MFCLGAACGRAEAFWIREMSIILRATGAWHPFVPAAALLLSAVLSTCAEAVQDIMLQTKAGKIVTGLVDDVSGVGTLGTRVYGRQFLLVSGSFRASNPGFYALRTGNPNMPTGAAGFPAMHDVNFDLLPMTIGTVSSNLFFWDGSNANGGDFDASDVNFVSPAAGVNWTQFDDNFSPFVAAGTNQLVPGGLIDRTSDDVWPDGIDSGTLHSHLAMQVDDSDGNTGTQPPAGIYMIAWQARSVGFETSDPFFLVMRSPTISDEARDAAVDWVEDQLNIPGDYNKNGVVDGADYVLWRKSNGQSGMGLAADGDGSLHVDQGDYTFWRQRFGNASQLIVSNSSGAGSALGAIGVPELGVAPLILMASWGAAYFRSRTRKKFSRISESGAI
jgi:hypothetical protein